MFLYTHPMNIETVPIQTLHFDPANARKHDEKNISSIKASLVKFKQQKPIVVDADNIVIAGNGTLQAAQSLGWKDIVVHRTHLKGPEAIAYAISDNRTAELAEWDKEALESHLKGLSTEIDLEEIGFTDDDLKELDLEWKPDGGPPEEKDDEIPEVEENIHNVKLGNIYQLGKHRLLCGDSTNRTDVDRLMDGATPVLMVTDPPYGVKLDQSWRDKALGDKAMGAGNAKTIKNDDRANWFETYNLFGGNIAYVWHATLFTDVVKSNLEEAGFDVRQMVIWNKSIMVMGRSAYHWKHEPCWYAVRKGKDANWQGDRKQTTVWDAESPNHIMSGSKDDKTEHPSQKPLSINEKPIMNHTVFGDGVYDPFLGSGSTLIACEKTNRTCYGMEIDPHYCSVIIERWQNYTNEKAELLNA